MEKGNIATIEIDHTHEVKQLVRLTIKNNDWLFVFLEDCGKYTLIHIHNKSYRKALKVIKKIRKDKPVQVLTGGYDMTDYELYHYAEIYNSQMVKIKPEDFCEIASLGTKEIYKNNLKMLLLIFIMLV